MQLFAETVGENQLYVEFSGWGFGLGTIKVYIVQLPPSKAPPPSSPYNERNFHYFNLSTPSPKTT